MARALLLAAFWLSGAAGLVYQVVWMRRLTLVLGVTHQAVAITLACFMGGLALGAWWLGRVGDRTRHPVRAYAGLELGIAAWGAASPWLFEATTAIWVALARDLGLPRGARGKSSFETGR